MKITEKEIIKFIKEEGLNYLYYLIFFTSLWVLLPSLIDKSKWVRWEWGYFNVSVIPIFLITLLWEIICLRRRIWKLEEDLSK